MNPGAETFAVQLTRDAAGQPWGFRLQGGADFATPLSVQSVRERSSVGSSILLAFSGDAVQLLDVNLCGDTRHRRERFFRMQK